VQSNITLIDPEKGQIGIGTAIVWIAMIVSLGLV